MRRTTLLAALSLAALPLAGCFSIMPSTGAAQQQLEHEARAVLAQVDAEDPAFGAQLRAAPAFAIFPDVGKGAAVLGFAYGRGVLYHHGQLVGYCDLTQGLLGAALGGQRFAEVVCLESPAATLELEHGVYKLHAQANAVLLRLGASAQSDYSQDVSVLVLDEAGLMFEASVGTQEIRCRLLEPNVPH
ncbi:MAG TPA: hypothetical protein VFF36_06655 [Planctomycetota bacterium]|nr:hypothetical protein [Planctomycetota bacterium]